MRLAVLVVAVLACASQGSRVQTETDQSNRKSASTSHSHADASRDGGGAPNQPKTRVLAMLLLAFNPAHAFQNGAALNGRTRGKSVGFTTMRPGPIVMDETIFEKALRGELEEEGAENVFMSEAGWAKYLDEQGQSYNMNERVSKAKDGYFTPDIFSPPIDNAKAFIASLRRAVDDPFEAGFPTISNDQSGARSWGKGDEIKSRTIKPKKKDFDQKKRLTGIPGLNIFGAPGSKLDLLNRGRDANTQRRKRRGRD